MLDTTQSDKVSGILGIHSEVRQRATKRAKHTSAFSGLLLLAAIVTLPGLAEANEPDHELVVLPALANGDINGDWALDLSDPIALLNHLFLGGPDPVPVLCGTEVASSQNGDANGDGALNLSDTIHLLDYIFLGGPDPAPACGLGTGAAALVARIPVSFVATLYVATGPPDRQWVDDDGVTHVRGFHAISDVVGDFVGTEVVNFNQNIDALGNGDGFTSFVFDVTWDGLNGTFEGRASVSIEAGVITADFVMHGTGDFDRMKTMGRARQREDGSFLHEGVVLIPGG